VEPDTGFKILGMQSLLQTSREGGVQSEVTSHGPAYDSKSFPSNLMDWAKITGGRTYIICGQSAGIMC